MASPSVPPRSPSSSSSWPKLLEHESVRTFLRAYSLGFGLSALPPLIQLVLSVIRRGPAPLRARLVRALRALARLLLQAADPRGLAMAAAVSLTGARLGQKPSVELLARARVRWERDDRRSSPSALPREDVEAALGERHRLVELKAEPALQAFATFLGATASALVGISLLQMSPAYSGASTSAAATPRSSLSQSETLDFTLFLLVRACRPIHITPLCHDAQPLPLR